MPKAERISRREFLSRVKEQYRQHGVIVEKYDAVRRSLEIGGDLDGRNDRYVGRYSHDREWLR